MTKETNDQSAFAAPPPDAELSRLEPLVGSWSSEGRTKDTVLGPGTSVSSKESFYWLEGGYFLVSTYETVFGNEPAQKGINYWGYDSEARKFRIIFFSNNGPFTEEGNRYEGRVSDNKLTFEGPARFQYGLDEQGKIRVGSDGTVSVDWWLRAENGTWQPWMSNTFSKVRD
jgi:Protein of unknown function (DUF1579)